MGKVEFWLPGVRKPLNEFRWNWEYIIGSRVCPHMQIHVALQKRGWSERTREENTCGFLGIPFFNLYFGSRRARTRGPIFTIYTSYDVFPPKDVPFGGLVHTAPDFGGKMPQKPIIWGREYAFSSLTCKILKFAYYWNYCTDYHQISHSHKDHQELFVGGPNTRKTYPRWRTAAILKNRIIAISQPRFERFRRNLAGRRRSNLLSVQTVKNSKFPKSKMAAAAILKNLKSAISLERFDRSSRNLVRWRSLSLRTGPEVEISNFWQSKMADGCHLKKSKNRYILAAVWAISTKLACTDWIYMMSNIKP